MSAGLLIDTDVLIDYLREARPAVDYLEHLTETLYVSTMTVGELYSGVREGKEREALNVFLQGFQILPIDSAVALKGGLFCRDHRKTHGTGLADALIAATAQIFDLELVTLNEKHFPMLQNLIIPYRKAAK